MPNPFNAEKRFAGHAGYVNAMLVHEVIERSAAKAPRDVALTDEAGNSETFQSLNEAAERTASLLYELGIRKGDRVAILSKNCFEVFHVLLGANKIGAIFLALNYRFPAREILGVLDSGRPKLVVFQAQYAALVETLRAEHGGPDGTWVKFDGDADKDSELEQLMQRTVSRTHRPRLSVEDVSLICYTGGTTGRSKGAMLTHRAILAAATNWIVHDRIAPDSVFLIAGALFHIVIASPFPYWQVGARCVVVNFEPRTTLDVIERERVTNLVASGTIFKMLIEEMEQRSGRPRRLQLRCINTGAAPVPLGLVRRATEIFGCGIGQIYGQTEVCITATYLYPEDYTAGLAPGASDAQRGRLRSVGKAAALSVVSIVDPTRADLVFLSTGETGEVVVRGDNTMSGYWGQRELTEETLVDGWVRTGDIGALDQDGYLYLRGRKRDLIITGGENVYANEVELVLVEHPAVDEAVVLGVPDDHWGERVHAIVVPAPGAVINEEDLSSFCRARLAAYKVPKSVETRTSLPRLTSNKVARAKLRAQYWPPVLTEHGEPARDTGVIGEMSRILYPDSS